MVPDEAIGLLLIILVGGLVAQIFYLLTLQNTLKAISSENRKMDPSQVWLVFIPLFGLVWQFIMINRISDSLKAEFAERGIPSAEDRPGYSLGITYCILLVCGIVPVLGGLASLGGLIVWIIYWVKMNEFKNLLGSPNKNQDQILD